MSVENDLDCVSTALNLAKNAGLESEMVCWALQIMSKNPNIPIHEALREALYEWDII